jgi:hypothetical protein
MFANPFLSSCRITAILDYWSVTDRMCSFEGSGGHLDKRACRRQLPTIQKLGFSAQRKRGSLRRAEVKSAFAFRSNYDRKSFATLTLMEPNHCIRLQRKTPQSSSVLIERSFSPVRLRRK